MSFSARLFAVSGALALLVAAFILGAVFSPQRMEERRSGASLVSLGPSALISSLEIYSRAANRTPLVALHRKGANRWEVQTGGLSYPASSDRVAALLQELLGLRRGNLVSSDPAKMAGLGLDAEGAHQVLLHVEGRPDTALLVGKRAPSGDEEYVDLRGEPSAFMTRSSIGVLLSQDKSYWYDLRVLPDEVQPGTIMSITVSGSVKLGAPGEGVLRADYTLARTPGGQGNGWQIVARKALVNPVTAAAMVNRVAELEGIDFAQTTPAAGGAATVRNRGLQIQIVAVNGDKFILRVAEGAEPGKLLVSTGWSSWTYIVDARSLAQTIFPLPDLLGGQ